MTTNQISINHAYTEALDHEQLKLPFEKKEAEEMNPGEEIHNVFLGNTFSSNELPSTKDVEEEKIEVISNRVSQISLSPSFKAKIVPFYRARDALKSMEKIL